MRKLLVPFAVLALVAVGCGGSKSGPASGGASGAAIAPASVLGFVAVNTDEGSTQWKNGDALLKKFPIRDQLLAAINSGLSSPGVDFNRDIRPLLGPELDFVLLAGSSGSPQLIGMTQPTDAKKFAGFLDKADPPTAHMDVDGWTVFSDAQAALDAFKEQADKAKLADDSSFKDATAGLPGETNVRAYVNGAQALGLLKQGLPQLGALPTGQLEWVGLALSSGSGSARIDGAVKTNQSIGGDFTPALLSKVPANALAVVSFHGSEGLSRQLAQNPALAQAAGQLQQLIGVGLTDLAALIQGEGVLFAAPGAPFPEVTLILEQADPTTAVATLNKVAAVLAVSLHGKLTDANAAGTIKKLDLGPVAIYFGSSGGTVVISDSIASLLAPRGTPITDDPVFSKAKDAAGLPDQSAGFAYVNLKGLLPVIEGFAQASGTAIPPAVEQNLAPLESFLGYATSSGGVATFSLLLQTR